MALLGFPLLSSVGEGLHCLKQGMMLLCQRLEGCDDRGDLVRRGRKGKRG